MSARSCKVCGERMYVYRSWPDGEKIYREYYCRRCGYRNCSREEFAPSEVRKLDKVKAGVPCRQAGIFDCHI